MKRLSFQNFTLVIAIICFVLSSCTKESMNGQGKGAGTGIGDVRPAGNPIEAPIRKIIGTNGGSVSSRDGRLTIAIPPGALTENTQISVTAITSTCDASMGNSYRLEPDIRFSQPVTITMSYEKYKDSVSGGSCGIGIGYQDSLGVWRLLTNRTVDESLHKISVQSNHFSDWTFLTPFKIAPAYSLITPGEEVILNIGAYVRITEDPCSFHNPNNPRELSIEKFYEVPDHYMDKWISLAGNTAGAGKLERLIVGASYQSTNYDAPDINPNKILAYFPKMIVPFQATIEVRPVSLGVFITVGSTTYVYDDCYAYGSEGDVGVVWSRSMGGRTYYGGGQLEA